MASWRSGCSRKRSSGHSGQRHPGAAAAPDATLRLLLIALALGSLILAPSLYYLMRVFKRP